MSDEIKKGLLGIVVDETTISHVVPELSTLTYRGYTVQELCDKCDFEEVAYLVLNGDLPNKKQLKKFLKDELIDINLVPEVGDILLFRNNFYEVDSRIENQLFMGRDPDYAIATETTNFGDSFSIIVNTHISRVEKLNLIPLREGKYPTTKRLGENRSSGVGSYSLNNNSLYGDDFIIE